jgi:hypothetical protein
VRRQKLHQKLLETARHKNKPVESFLSRSPAGLGAIWRTGLGHIADGKSTFSSWLCDSSDKK